jgi:hypothetical protein
MNDTMEHTERIRAQWERQRVQRLAHRTRSARELADRVAGSSEETAALFDSGYRDVSELGVDPHQD